MNATSIGSKITDHIAFNYPNANSVCISSFFSHYQISNLGNPIFFFFNKIMTHFTNYKLLFLTVVTSTASYKSTTTTKASSFKIPFYHKFHFLIIAALSFIMCISPNVSSQATLCTRPFCSFVINI